MINSYIATYNSLKDSIGIIASIRKVLEKLKEDRKNWLSAHNKDLSWQSIKLFYNAETTQKNLEVIDDILDKLNKSIDEHKNTLNEFIEYVEKEKLHQLSFGGATKELLEHVLVDFRKAPIDPFYLKSSNPTSINLDILLQRKNLPQNLFANNTIAFEADINEHAKWIFEHIYSIPYPSEHKTASKIAREVHGIQHVSRAAINIRVFVNLYIRHGDAQASKLTEEDIKLLQIAALFHDSARENDGEDLWDRDSATLLFHYFTKVLSIDKEKAKLIAEATANKDIYKDKFFQQNVYYELHEEASGNISWKKIPAPLTKNIYQKLIHDADCAEINRAVLDFDYRYLDFYQNIAGSKNEEEIVKEILQLKKEVKSLISVQGDFFADIKPEIKVKYEHAGGYSCILNDINPPQYKMLHALYADNKLLSTEQAKEQYFFETSILSYTSGQELTEELLNYLAENGRVFGRGVWLPSAINKKKRPINEILTGNCYESLTGKEIRKCLRAKGNPERSISMLSYGAAAYCSAGFLIIDPSVDSIQEVSATDFKSGHGKKSNDLPQYSKEEKTKKITDLLKTLKTGGVEKNYTKAECVVAGVNNAKSTHTEIIYHIKRGDFKAIFYTQDPNLVNIGLFKNSKAKHPHSPILQAIFLQKEYKNHCNGEELPIFEYSLQHENFKKLPNLTNENIINMWEEMCDAYIVKKLTHENATIIKNDNIFSMSIEEIKIFSMYIESQATLGQEWIGGPADRNYPQHLQEAINNRLKILYDKRINEYCAPVIESYMADAHAFICNHKILPLILKEKIHISEILKQKIISDIQDKIINIPVKGSVSTPDNIKIIETIYPLTIKLGLDDLKCKIQDMAMEAFSLKLNQVSAWINKEDFITGNFIFFINLTNIIDFCQTFNIFIKVQLKIQETIRNFLDHLHHFINTENFLDIFSSYEILIYDLHKRSALNDEHKIAIRDFIKNVYEPTALSESEKYQGLKNYLSLSSLIETPIKEVKEKTLKAIKHYSGLEHLVLRFNSLKKLSLLDDNDVFEKIIDKIKNISNDISNGRQDGTQAIIALREQMPNKKFTLQQNSYINNTFSGVFSEREELVTNIKTPSVQHEGFAPPPQEPSGFQLLLKKFF